MYEFQRTASFVALRAAWQKIAAKNRIGGMDGVDINFYRADVTANIERLGCALKSGAYAPYPEKQGTTGDRTIYISCIDDKIVQTSMANVINESINHSPSVHGFIKKRSVDTAHLSLKKAIRRGITMFYKTDVLKFYDSIDIALLMRRLGELISDSRFLELTELVLNFYARRKGISTGSCLSPALSNLYLAKFDKTVQANSAFYARYADDMLIAPKRGETISDTVSLIDDELGKVGLSANTDKSAIVNADDGFRYLGFNIAEKNRKKILDNALTLGNFSLAQKLYDEQNTELEEADDRVNYADYLALFVRNTDKYFVSDSYEERYKEVDSKLDNAELNALVNAKKEFAIPAQDENGNCPFAVFDIDIDRQIILNHGDDGNIFANLLTETEKIAAEIVRRCKAVHVNAYVEFSGYKGYHIWVFWKASIDVKNQKTFFNRILDGFELPAGIHIERFATNCDQRIKLPLSFHSLTGKQTVFVNAKDQLEYIGQIRYSDFPEVCLNPQKVKPAKKTEYPEHIVAIYDKCKIVHSIVDKARMQNYINYQERNTLLCVFHCLDAGDRYLHSVMRHCVNYNYEKTQGYIDRCSIAMPIGCKKLTERFEDEYGKSGCTCNFGNADMYPSPIIHAKRVQPKCFTALTKKEKIGHFKPLPDKQNVADSLSRLMELNRREQEIKSQKRVFREKIELLFERNGITEMETPQGLVVRTEQGLCIKL
jgi:retron-type reverse transcriptase